MRSNADNKGGRVETSKALMVDMMVWGGCQETYKKLLSKKKALST